MSLAALFACVSFVHLSRAFSDCIELSPRQWERLLLPLSLPRPPLRPQSLPRRRRPPLLRPVSCTFVWFSFCFTSTRLSHQLLRIAALTIPVTPVAVPITPAATTPAAEVPVVAVSVIDSAPTPAPAVLAPEPAPPSPASTVALPSNDLDSDLVTVLAPAAGATVVEAAHEAAPAEPKTGESYRDFSERLLLCFF